MTLKQQIHQQCHHILTSRLNSLRQKLQDLSESMANETKSSAGDKYETARAMLHIEQDQVNRQIAELMTQQAVLNTIDPSSTTQHISLGSLALIDGTYYYISTSLGKMQLSGKTVIALSQQSPLGTKLKGLKAGDKLSINGKELIINEIN